MIGFSHIRAIVLLSCLLGLAPGAHAANNISFVASNGNDSAACTRAAPCATLQFAHNQTNAGGIVIAIDDGDYGALTITKSITISAGDKLASIETSATVPVTINAADSDKVVLQGLAIDGFNRSFSAIDIQRAGLVYVIDSTIKNAAVGVNNGSATSNGRVFVQNCTLIGNGTGATASGAGRVISIADSLIDRSITAGINANGGIVGLVRSVINAGPQAITSSAGGLAVSIGPSNVTSGSGAFSLTLPMN